jgi:NAD(P)-dependent dehydrogenase (short-subunit alcohol dehydrogenase family)
MSTTLPPPSASPLAGEIALVTGGGTGLGLGIARALHAAGARVCLVGRRPAPLEEAARELGAGALAFAADITLAADRARLLAEIAERTGGPVSILVNNAGVHLKKPALEVTDEEFDRVLSTHVGAAFSLTRDIGREMVARRHGSVVFVASMTSYIGMPNVVGYTAAKSAILGLTRAFASEWAAHGVRVNAIAPGWIESPMLHQALDGDPARKAKIVGRIPGHEFGRPQDIGSAVAFLCSPAAAYINSVILPVDGGAHCGF